MHEVVIPADGAVVVKKAVKLSSRGSKEHTALCVKRRTMPQKIDMKSGKACQSSLSRTPP